MAVGTTGILLRLLALHRRLKKQEAALTIGLTKTINTIITGYSPDATQTKRTVKYYQLAYNLICNNLYELSGHSLTPAENKRIILLSIFGPLFDDLYDEQLISHEQINALLTSPEKYQPSNNTDFLVKALYLELLHTTPRPGQFKEMLQRLSHWEKESQQQLDTAIAEEALYQITYNKSYYAVLLFCTVLDHYPAEAITRILYPIAGLMQLTNDAFDVYKDTQNGVFTLPNLYRHFDELKQQFLSETASINKQLLQLPYTKKAIRRYAITIHSLHAMGWLSLEQLQSVTAGVADVAALKQLPRKTLVCDMDSLSQQLRWLRHIKRFCQLQ